MSPRSCRKRAVAREGQAELVRRKEGRNGAERCDVMEESITFE